MIRVFSDFHSKLFRFHETIVRRWARFCTRWAPSSYEWSYNPYKWPYKWLTVLITLVIGVINPVITGSGGPPCRDATPLKKECSSQLQNLPVLEQSSQDVLGQLSPPTRRPLISEKRSQETSNHENQPSLEKKRSMLCYFILPNFFLGGGDFCQRSSRWWFQICLEFSWIFNHFIPKTRGEWFTLTSMFFSNGGGSTEKNFN